MSLEKKPLLISLFFMLGIVLYFTRAIFFYKYEPEYYENYYYHSQWNIPNSTRGISDGELYKFVGYAILKGENPFDINYEVPPLGKSLYGLAELTVGNPYWVSIFLYLSSVAVFYKLLLFLTKEDKLSLSGTLLFASTPFITTQVKETMLDLPLTFFYLVHTYFFIRFLSKNKVFDLLLSGIFLGCATATKLGVYTPFVLVLDVVLALIVSKNRLKILLYPFSVFAGYVFGFFAYFIRHPNPIPWIRLHKKIYDFYSISGGNETGKLAQWKGIFTGSMGDWSPVIVVGVCVTVYVLLKRPKEKTKQWLYISFLAVIFLLVNTYLPFYSRYLMPAVLLFVLLVVEVFKKARWVIFLLILLNLPFIYKSLAVNNPKGHAEPIAKFIATRAYRELYRSIRDIDRDKIDEQFFIDTQEKFFNDIGIRFIKVEFEEESVERDLAKYKYKITYDTRYGELVQQPIFVFEKVHNRWKLVWDWECLWKGFNPNLKVQVDEGQIPLHQVKNQDGIIATRAPGKEIYVVPRVMFDWTWHLNELSKLTGESTLSVDERVKSVIPDHYPRFIGYLDPRISYESVKNLDIPGVTYEDISYLKIASGKLTTRYELENFYQFLQESKDLLSVQADVFLVNDKGDIVSEIRKKGSEENRVIEYTNAE